MCLQLDLACGLLVLSLDLLESSEFQKMFLTLSQNLLSNSQPTILVLLSI